MRTRTAIPLIAMLLILCGCEGKRSHSTFAPRVDGALVNRYGQPLQTEQQLDAPYILLYFSAHWCPPCQAFTPKLVHFYNTRGGGRLFQVVFISSDHNERDMYNYMQNTRMPWPAVRYRSQNAAEIHESYANSGIPQLVLLNPDGKVLADSFRGRQYLGPQHVLDKLSPLLAKLKPTSPKKAPQGNTQVDSANDSPAPPPDKLLKSLHVTGLFAQTAGKSMVLVNGSLFHEGDTLAPGIVVEKITASYVEVSYDSHRYQLAP